MSPGAVDRAYRPIRKVGFRLEAERAHELAVSTMSLAAPLLARAIRPPSDPRLARRVWELDFPNPVGLAAGYDKRARAIPAWRALGFGFVEVGTITPLPQPGNERPRMFRLPEHEALINRMGFNNDGAARTAERLAAVTARGSIGIPIGVNVGKGRDTPVDRAAQDYAEAIERLWPHADYLVVNVSSPNTPGLRDLQESGALGELLSACDESNRRRASTVARPPRPLLVKLAPDLSDAQVEAVLRLADDRGLDGLVVCNTTIGRDGVSGDRHGDEAGGLSGRPLAARSLAMLRRIVAQAPGSRVISVGGIVDADDVWERLVAGAALVQVWTALAYRGPGVVAEINRGLIERMEREGVRDLDEIAVR